MLVHKERRDKLVCVLELAFTCSVHKFFRLNTSELAVDEATNFMLHRLASR